MQLPTGACYKIQNMITPTSFLGDGCQIDLEMNQILSKGDIDKNWKGI